MYPSASTSSLFSLSSQMGTFDTDASSSSPSWVGFDFGSNGGYGFSRYFGCATLVALVVILLSHLVRKFPRLLVLYKRRVVSSAPLVPQEAGSSQSGIGQIITEADLKSLIAYLDDKFDANEKWDTVVEKRNNLLSYCAKCCKQKDTPLKYLSTTVFENCSSETLRDFYMDNDYRKQWDKTIIEHDQLQVDTASGTEIGRTLKKFPLLTPREYILAWRLWEGKEKTFYCFNKECEHPLAPRGKKYVRVDFFRSCWRIRKMPGRDACEIKLYYQEDAGLNIEMAKLAFSRGIWSYVCKMDDAFRKYSVTRGSEIVPAVTAVSLIQKIPPELETTNVTDDISPSTTAAAVSLTDGAKQKKLCKVPSKKLLANGLLLLGGAVCLTCAPSGVGAKVVMACVLSKLRKRDALTSQKS